ncbi:Threonine/homoserine efflux transporter RhtA [Salinibacillus kushneri]|uniref:Threonine/homoserine efflux transporter RhtA n=1 Tax=Salinibacillus kushneri TaxID=237682 RepID=A0A1I0I872_9BACI|nr:EamA family transporter [Salinibacillus kushneri]SET92833.1 Threonine/homoserine efflux transporter RhtA [Salinibacillus kushneri]
MRRALILIIMGAALWGTIGWYVNHLYDLGFSPLEVITIRVSSTSILLVFYFGMMEKRIFKLQTIKDVKYFIGTGIFSIVFFNYCLFTTMNLSTLPVATALLYTAPIIVAILSRVLFQEAFTQKKFIALIASMTGILLIVEVIPFSSQSFQYLALLFGLGSGLGYALYSIFSKYALEKYHSKTITLYTFIVATVGLMPFFPFDKIQILIQPEAFFYAIGLGLFPTALAYIIYTIGLKDVEASKAAIFSTIEPVVATIIGVILFNEAFSFIQALGMVCIITSVIILEKWPEKKASTMMNVSH